MSEEDMIEYAIRYCITRQSYAYADGFDAAEAHWSNLSTATRDDVLSAVQAHGFPSNDSPRRDWPAIWAAYTDRDHCPPWEELHIDAISRCPTAPPTTDKEET